LKNTLTSDTAGFTVSRWPPLWLSGAMKAGSAAWAFQLAVGGYS
jgi:hypothetical protein